MASDTDLDAIHAERELGSARRTCAPRTGAPSRRRAACTTPR